MINGVLFSVFFLPLAIFFTFISRRWLLRRARLSQGLRLPPGPPGLPLIGNFRDMPRGHPWITYAKWAEKYGDIIYVENFGEPMIILNSAKAVDEILEKRSSNYSDRPRMHMTDDLVGWYWDFAHMKYGDFWRRHRRTFHQYFRPDAVATYQPVQLKSTHTFLRRLVESPDKFTDHVRQHAGSIILRLVYGYDSQPSNDYYVGLASKAVEGVINTVIVGSYLVDFLPILKYVPDGFPGAGFKRMAKEWKKSALDLRDRPFELLKTADGSSVPSFCVDNLEALKNSQSSHPDQEEVIKNCAGIAYLAGSDTTVSVIMSFILAMVLYPDVQKRAQAELDAVIGTDRLPNFGDQSDLPYIDCIVSESLRWNPVANLALPHRNMAEDVYEGYYIPQGSTVVGNVWAIFHDTTEYPDPFAFRPERFLKAPGKKMPRDPAAAAFGFGRRVCPGRYLGLNSVWISVANILSSFNITRAVDSEGKEIIPPAEYASGLLSHPKPFMCRFVPRSSNTLALIQSTDESG